MQSADSEKGKKGEKHMEMIIVAGMIAAFFAGAYIRQPFGKRERAAKPAPIRQAGGQKEKDRQTEQLNNLMNYNGSRQYPHEEE